MEFVTSILCFPLYLLTLYIVYKQLKFFIDVCKIPAPWAPLSLQVFGILLKFYEKTEAQRLKILQFYVEKYPKVRKIFFGHMFVLFVHDPDIIQKIYSSQKCCEKPFFYKFFGFGDGLITARLKSWKLHRKILNSAFNLKCLQSFISIFDESSRNLVKELEKKLGAGAFNLVDYAAKYTLDSICATSFGINIKIQENKSNLHVHIQRIHELAAVRMFNVHYYLDCIYQQSKYWKDDVIARSHCLEFATELVNRRREKMNEDTAKNDLTIEKYEIDDDLRSSTKKPQIFVDQLLKSNVDKEVIFTDSQIRDHALTILSAGNETSALVISVCVLFLAIHPEIQDRVYQEIKQVYGNKNTQITFENLRDLQYMDMVIKETLRLAPPAPLISRVMTEDTYFDNGMMLPKGTHTLLFIFALHRLKCYWGPDADKFNPDNFLPENVAQRHPFSYMPFSSGVRNCIGYKYAMLSMKVALVNLLLEYQITTPLKMEDLEFRVDVVLMLTNPYLIEISRRSS